MVDAERNYVGGAFITRQDIKRKILTRLTTNAVPLPKGLKPKPDVQWWNLASSPASVIFAARKTARAASRS